MERDQIFTENYSKLRQDLAEALEIIKHYEVVIAELQNENSSNLKKLAHDLANPLQILSMTLESIEDRVSSDLTPSVERMKRSTETMTGILKTIRNFRTQSSTNKISQIV